MSTESDRLPGWFRLGAWVTDETGPAMAVGQIRRIDLDEEEVDVAWVRYCGAPKVSTRETLPLGSALFPVRFREPTFEEGVAFLGKVMVSPNKLRKRAQILLEVSQALDDCENLLTTFNGVPWECLQACTVEGIPFGMAVRAEEERFVSPESVCNFYRRFDNPPKDWDDNFDNEEE